jgi:glycosyltransferase involved in cell wall biosynthesis
MALRQKADIYHLHDPELMLVGILLKLITGKKVIYDVHEDYSKQMLFKLYLPKIIRKEIAFLVGMIESYSSKLLDAIITATDDILKNFSRHKRVLSVKNFPIVSNFPIEEENEEREKGVFSLIYIGGLEKIRGITQIIEALAVFNSDDPLRLVLCGDFYPANFEAKVRSLEGFKKVEYLGWVAPRDIPNLLKNHDVGIVCLHPTTNYVTSLPLKLFEYMAAGLPVIASNFPLWKTIVEGNGCGICVDPLNPEEIAQAIKYLMEHPGLREEMGEKGRRAVAEKYNWEKEGKKLLDLYAQLLAR